MKTPNPAGDRNPSMPGEEILTEADVCALMNWSNVKTPQTYRARGLGPPFRKLGRRVIYLRSDVETWLRSLPRFSSTSEATVTTVTTVKGEAA